MASYGSTWPVYAREWDEMQRTRLSMAQSAARTALANKARYVTVAALWAKAHPGSDLPWYFVAPIHYREADYDFSTQLAQGDPLDRVSTHVPAGQGPYLGPNAWERACIIALEGRKLQSIRDFNVLEKLLYQWEEYNGEGYRNHNVPSAYVWAGTSIYKGGFFVSDGVWSPTAQDPRVGCAPILKCLMELDSTIKPVRETPVGVPAPQPLPAPAPEPIPVPGPQIPVPVPAPVPPPATEITMDPAVLIAAFSFVARFIPQLAPFAPLVPKLAPILAQLIADWPKISAAAPGTATNLLNAVGVLADHFAHPPQPPQGGTT